MRIGLIGLGRMGMNMAKRLLEGGHEVVACNRTPEKVEQIVAEGAEGAFSLTELVEKLTTPRIIWIMLPAGQTVDDHIKELTELLTPNDIIIEGGNSFYKDDIRRHKALLKHGIRYMDVGVSGGIWGYELGYCTMAGEKRIFLIFLSRYSRPLPRKKGIFIAATWEQDIL